MKKNKTYYHFTAATLRNGEPIPPIGDWLIFADVPVPCKCGYHASPDAFDALQYAPGAMLHQVELGGNIVAHGDPVDKYAAQKRMILASIDATEILRLFARRVALDVIHLWDAPLVVREYLEIGDESKRHAAWNAASNAASNAAEVAARSAAWNAAESAAWHAAESAAWNAAESAAESAAWNAKQKLYRGWFNEMVEAAFAIQKEATK